MIANFLYTYIIQQRTCIRTHVQIEYLLKCRTIWAKSSDFLFDLKQIFLTPWFEVKINLYIKKYQQMCWSKIATSLHATLCIRFSTKITLYCPTFEIELIIYIFSGRKNGDGSKRKQKLLQQLQRCVVMIYICNNLGFQTMWIQKIFVLKSLFAIRFLLN